MRGINFRYMLANWDLIVKKICEECTPYDVLGSVVEYLGEYKQLSMQEGVSAELVNEAIDLIQKAREKINPEM
jgi:hypothetical protein